MWFGQLWTGRYVASAIATDSIAHLRWLAVKLRGPDKAFQCLHEQLLDVIPNRGQLESISRITGRKRLVSSEASWTLKARHYRSLPGCAA